MMCCQDVVLGKGCCVCVNLSFMYCSISQLLAEKGKKNTQHINEDGMYQEESCVQESLVK